MCCGVTQLPNQLGTQPFTGLAVEGQRREHDGQTGVAFGSVVIAGMSAPSKLPCTDVERRCRTVEADGKGRYAATTSQLWQGSVHRWPSVFGAQKPRSTS